MATAPQFSIGIVLDTSCVRGTPRSALRALTHLGFRVHVSGLALDELSVHFAQPSVGEACESERAKLRSRMVFLSELVADVPPIAPTHSPLVDKLGGEIVGMESLSYSTWLQTVRAEWRELERGGPLSRETADDVEENARYVRETGADFVKTFGRIASLGEPTREVLEFGAAIPRTWSSIVDRIRLPQGISAAERFDAYSRLLDIHGEGAHERSTHRRVAHTGNHAIDLNLMQHLADGLIVVTSDYELVEEVDASQTVQAPWVRTVGELLLGMVPMGEPFADNARRAALHHTARTRAELRRMDTEGLARAHEAAVAS